MIVKMLSVVLDREQPKFAVQLFRAHGLSCIPGLCRGFDGGIHAGRPYLDLRVACGIEGGGIGTGQCDMAGVELMEAYPDERGKSEAPEDGGNCEQARSRRTVTTKHHEAGGGEKE